MSSELNSKVSAEGNNQEVEIQPETKPETQVDAQIELGGEIEAPEVKRVQIGAPDVELNESPDTQLVIENPR